MPNFNLLDIGDNFFTETEPDGLCDGGKLQSLYLKNNNLEGALSLSFAHCASLVKVSFPGNQISSIPDGFGSNSSLELLLAARNQLTGQLPRALGANSHLASLDLSENMFTGDISILEFSQLAKNLSV